MFPNVSEVQFMRAAVSIEARCCACYFFISFLKNIFKCFSFFLPHPVHCTLTCDLQHTFINNMLLLQEKEVDISRLGLRFALDQEEIPTTLVSTARLSLFSFYNTKLSLRLGREPIEYRTILSQ